MKDKKENLLLSLSKTKVCQFDCLRNHKIYRIGQSSYLIGPHQLTFVISDIPHFTQNPAFHIELL